MSAMITPERKFKTSAHRRNQVRLAMARWRINNREKYLARKKELYDYDKTSIYYDNNRERILTNQRFNRYGLTSDDYQKFITNQNNSCAICKIGFDWLSAKFIQIDHCHKTGKVRGLLCNDCNLGLGRFKDNVEFLKSAMSYLKND